MDAQHAVMVASAAWLICLGAFVSGCGVQSCPGIYKTPYYRISVRDADTHSPICDATVHVRSVTAKPSNCKYGAEIPLGLDTASVEVSRTGYKTLTTNVSTRYETDSCGNAVPKSVVLDLEKL